MYVRVCVQIIAQHKQAAEQLRVFSSAPIYVRGSIPHASQVNTCLTKTLRGKKTKTKKKHLIITPASSRGLVYCCSFGF